VTEGSRKLHNKEMYSSPNIISINKSRRVRWALNVVCMQTIRNAYKIFFDSLKEKDNSESLDVDGRMILKWILMK
jgi:hypothetical protein